MKKIILCLGKIVEVAGILALGLCLYSPWTNVFAAEVKSKIFGDVNGDGQVNLADAIIANKIISGIPVESINSGADVNNDGKIGPEELIYILQIISSQRDNVSVAIAAAAGANGNISPSGTTTLSKGANLSYTITPNQGYVVNTVTVDGINVGALTTYFFSNVVASHIIAATFTAIPAYQVYGFNFGPHLTGQSPGTQISNTQIRDRLRIIAPYTKAVRTFRSNSGEENICMIAREFGLKCYQGIWIEKNKSANQDDRDNQTQITNAILSARNGYADAVVIGSENLLRFSQNDDSSVPPETLIGYINQVKAALPGILVTTGDTYNSLLDNPKVMAACDLIFVNYYPLWEGYAFDKAAEAFHKMHQKIVQAAAGKKVVVSEIGWSSCGSAPGQAVPSLTNAAYLFKNFVSWARTFNIDYFYFEAFDEAWKTANVGPVEGCWGVWYENGVMKPGMIDVFNGQTMTDNWSCASLVDGEGTKAIAFTSIPPLGTKTNAYLKGTVSHLVPADHKIVLYIKVAGNWWIKPTYAQPLTDINCDGTWQVNTVTGGIDETADEFAVYVINPANFSPPTIYDQALLQANSIIWKTTTR